MDNFRLTTKAEVLDYLANKKLILKREQKVAYFKSIGSACLVGAYWMWTPTFVSAAYTSSIITEDPIIFFGEFTIAGLIGIVSNCFLSRSIGEYYICRTRVAENDKKMKWVKNGTFQKNTLRALENEVVMARKSDFSKVKINPGKF